MVAVNKELREQLEAATENSDKLLIDVNKLNENWEKLNKDFIRQRKGIYIVVCC